MCFTCGSLSRECSCSAFAVRLKALKSTTTASIHELGIGYSTLAFRAQVATEKITSLSEEYRDVARRGSLLYFVITDLHKMNSLYVYSLNAFVAIFQVRHSHCQHCLAVLRNQVYRKGILELEGYKHKFFHVEIQAHNWIERSS